MGKLTLPFRILVITVLCLAIVMLSTHLYDRWGSQILKSPWEQLYLHIDDYGNEWLRQGGQWELQKPPPTREERIEGTEEALEEHIKRIEEALEERIKRIEEAFK